MSAEPTPITAELIDYIRRHAPPEGPFLRELKDAARAAQIPEIWIGPDQAAFMQILLRLAGAHTVVEVGTLAGVGAITMARALPPDGHLRTLELLDAHADFAEAWIARSDVAGRIEVLRGDARTSLVGLESASADACFIDADKEGYLLYLEQCLRIVRPGGLVMVDNAFAFGEVLDAGSPSAEVRAIQAFNEHVAHLAELQAIIVPLGDGLWVGVRR